MAVAKSASGTIATASLSSAATTQSPSFITVASGDTFLLMMVEVDSATPGTPVAKWDVATANQTMTLLGTVVTNSAAGTPMSMAMFGLVSPATGAKLFTITFPGLTAATNAYINAISFTGTVTTSVAAAIVGFQSASTTATGTAMSVTSSAAIASGNMAVACWNNINGYASAFPPVSDGGTAIGKNQGLTTNFASEYYSGAGSAITASTASGLSGDQFVALIVGLVAGVVAPPVFGKLLAGKHYDPATAVTKSTAVSAMTAFDTTNLRLTFVAPINGKVLVRIFCPIALSTSPGTLPFFGILEGTTVRAKLHPMGTARPVVGNVQGAEAVFCISGLTPGTSYTWDAAYGIEQAPASGGALSYGGPNDTTGNNAWGGIAFEIWEVPNLLASILYDPTAVALKATTASIPMTAFDTTNLRLTFVAPQSGTVTVKIVAPHYPAGATGFASVILGVLQGTTVMGRAWPVGGIRQNPGSGVSPMMASSSFVVTGLTPGTSYTWDAAYDVEAVGATNANINYGGPDDTATNSAAGAILFEIWDSGARRRYSTQPMMGI